MKTVVQTLWIGSEMSLIERLCLRSFLAHGHDVHLYCYAEVGQVPEGVTLKDANAIIPESEVFTYQKGSYAGFADRFRHELMFQTGEFWVDTDVICLKPFDFDDEWVFGLEESDCVGSAVLRFPAGHELPRLLADACHDPHAFMPWDERSQRIRKIRRRWLRGRNPAKIKWGETGGPVGVTRALRHFGLFERALPHTAFFPVSSVCWRSTFDETFAGHEAYFQQSYGLHLWNERMRLCPEFDKNGAFPPGSFIECLRRRYGEPRAGDLRQRGGAATRSVRAAGQGPAKRVS